MTKCIAHSLRSVSDWAFWCFSPQGQRFRSRASLQAFLLKNGDGTLDINFFDFTASKDDVVTTSSQLKQRRRKKKHANGQQEDATEVLDSPPSKSKRASSSLEGTNEEKAKSSEDIDTVPEETAQVRVEQGAPETTLNDDTLLKSPQRAGLLREKLLRLASTSNQQSALIVHKQNEADCQPSLPTLNVEPATESENEGEDERGGDEMLIYSKGDNKPNSEPEAVADSSRDAEEEVLLPAIPGGSCTPVRESQNSKYDLHCLTACKSSSSS